MCCKPDFPLQGLSLKFMSGVYQRDQRAGTQNFDEIQIAIVMFPVFFYLL